MTTSEHPSLEDLLLWQSGELSPDQAAEVAAHVAACSQCRKDVSEAGELFGDVASVNAEAAQWQMRRRLDEEQRVSWFSRLLHPARSRWIPVSASVLIVSLVLYTFSDLTPEARADELLENAAHRESGLGTQPHFVSFHANGFRCFAEAGSAEARLLPASSSHSCQILSGRLQSAGWSYNDLLSAKGFERWRSGLKKKSDSIHKSAKETEIRTSTKDSSVRTATLRLRNSDLHPIAESLEFAPSEEGTASTIEIAEAPLSEIAALSVPVTGASALAASPKEIASSSLTAAISPLEIAEAHALLALHQLGVDRNVLVDVQRGTEAVKVWGVTSTDSQKTAVVAALSDLSDVTIAVRTEEEEKQSPQPLPWRAYQGDGPPLAQEQLQELFPNTPQELQEFVNSLDRTTLQLAAEARSRDALLPLTRRLSATEEAAPLHQAADNLQQAMVGQIASLARQLQPLTGPVPITTTVLSYPRAVELYTLVHQVAYMSNSQTPVALDDATSRIRRLLAGR